MSTVVTDTPTAEVTTPYLEAVSRRLAGVPAAERTDILDDLTQHLSELAAEPGDDLETRLGPPDDYADEFVASLGLEATPGAAGHSPGRLRALLDRCRQWPWVTALRAFWPELRPGWWVVRGYLVVAALAAMDGDGSVLPFPDLGGPLVGTALAVAAAVGSVRIGRGRADRFRRWDVAGSVAGLIAVLVVMSNLGGGTTYVSDSGYTAVYSNGYLTAGDGRAITNLFVYDAAGNLLQDVFVYDQDGRPINDLATFDSETGELLVEEPRFDANGAVIGNLFPRRLQHETYPDGHTLVLAPIPPPAITVPSLPPDTTTTTVATETTTTTVPPETTTTLAPEPSTTVPGG